MATEEALKPSIISVLGAPLLSTRASCCQQALSKQSQDFNASSANCWMQCNGGLVDCFLPSHLHLSR
eukprot:4593383-Amphidinium_carterae.1